jgi:hypothetical protein
MAHARTLQSIEYVPPRMVGVVLFFHSPSRLPAARTWLKEATDANNREHSLKVFLVGLKNDLVVRLEGPSHASPGRRRRRRRRRYLSDGGPLQGGPLAEQLSQDARALADKLAAEYWEVSAKHGAGARGGKGGPGRLLTCPAGTGMDELLKHIAVVAFEHIVLQTVDHPPAPRPAAPDLVVLPPQGPRQALRACCPLA